MPDYTFRQLQDEVRPWTLHNFGDTDETPETDATLGLAEETGEVCRAVLKRAQGIRGSYEEWTAEIAKELGDVIIKVADVAIRCGLDLEEIVRSRWQADIKKRDWRADRVGHGIGG